MIINSGRVLELGSLANADTPYGNFFVLVCQGVAIKGSPLDSDPFSGG